MSAPPRVVESSPRWRERAGRAAASPVVRRGLLLGLLLALQLSVWLHPFPGPAKLLRGTWLHPAILLRGLAQQASMILFTVLGTQALVAPLAAAWLMLRTDRRRLGPRLIALGLGIDGALALIASGHWQAGWPGRLTLALLAELAGSAWVARAVVGAVALLLLVRALRLGRLLLAAGVVAGLALAVGGERSHRLLQQLPAAVGRVGRAAAAGVQRLAARARPDPTGRTGSRPEIAGEDDETQVSSTFIERGGAEGDQRSRATRLRAALREAVGYDWASRVEAAIPPAASRASELLKRWRPRRQHPQ